MNKKQIILLLLVAAVGSGMWQILQPVKESEILIRIRTRRVKVNVNETKLLKSPDECLDNSFNNGLDNLFDNIPNSPVGISLNTSIPITSLLQSDMMLNNYNVTTGTHTTITITSRDSLKNRNCNDGDLWEVNANSSSELVGIQIKSLGFGKYTGLFTPRLPGTYDICRKLLYTSRVRGAPRLFNTSKSTYRYGAFRDSFFMKNEDIIKKHSDWCPGGQQADIDMKCIQLIVTGTPTLPTEVCKDTWNDGLVGSWVFVPEKDGKRSCSSGICVGDLNFIKSDGWVYVPYSCHLRIYNREAAWNCLANKSIVMFGDSTLRQTATNLFELILGTPALGDKSFKWVWAQCHRKTINMHNGNRCKHNSKCLGKYRASMYCPDYNTIRQWAGKRPSPFKNNDHVFGRLIWGGGRKKNSLWGVRPAAFDHFADEGCSHKGGCTKQRSELEHSLKTENPDIIILNGFLWDQENHDWDKFYAKVNQTISFIKRLNPKTKIHFNNAHPQCADDRRNEFPIFCWRILIGKMQQLVAAENNEKLLHQLSKDHPEVVMSDRYSMALSHLSNEFCHQGMHFGSSVADCLIFDVDHPQSCLRNWRVDKFMQQFWLNHACPSNVLPMSESPSGISILDGVPDHLGNWVNKKTAVDPNDLFKQFGVVIKS